MELPISIIYQMLRQDGLQSQTQTHRLALAWFFQRKFFRTYHSLGRLKAGAGVTGLAVVIPEPGILAVVALGAAALGVRLRRR